MRGQSGTPFRSRGFVRGALLLILVAAVLAGCSSENTTAPPLPDKVQDCSLCHKAISAEWSRSGHSATQLDVAGELGEERNGATPDEVINGADAENCIACHGARAVLANGGMTEPEALGYFFTTSGGVFTGATELDHVDEWPHVACQTCHAVPDNHPASLPEQALFDSRTSSYMTVDKSSALCGQCHGSLRFPGTDHLTWDAWSQSKMAATQEDVAGELAEERAGQSASEVVNGDDAENCIACHAPTAILANGGMSEVAALEYFFTTSGGTFGAGTVSDHADEWPDVSCTACHDPHNPGARSYFNSSTGQYEVMGSVNDLCGQCHGDLRFPATDHLSYNIMQGTGGIGVPDQQFMGERSCDECHMFASGVEDTRSTMFRGHSFGITVTEEDGSKTTSCTTCHPSIDSTVAEGIILGYRATYDALLNTATANVEAAAAALVGSTDQTMLDKLAEAQGNLALAAGDESGGFHNHTYTQALLNDANDRAQEILATR